MSRGCRSQLGKWRTRLKGEWLTRASSISTEALDDEVAKSRATLEKEVLKFRSRLSSARGELAEESNRCSTFTIVR